VTAARVARYAAAISRSQVDLAQVDLARIDLASGEPALRLLLHRFI
jgi:hypothetical protein